MAAVIGQVRDLHHAAVRRRPRLGPDGEPRGRARDRRLLRPRGVHRRLRERPRPDAARTSARSPPTASRSAPGSVAHVHQHHARSSRAAVGRRSIAATGTQRRISRCRRDPDQRPAHRDGHQRSRAARGQGRRSPTCRCSPTPASARRRSTRCSAIADGVFVGTSLKRDGVTWNAVDPERAGRFMTRGAARARHSSRLTWPKHGSTSSATCTARACASGSSSTRRRSTSAKVMILGGDVAGQGDPVDRARARRSLDSAGSSAPTTTSSTGPSWSRSRSSSPITATTRTRRTRASSRRRRRPAASTPLFLELMRARLTEWLELADARLRPLGIPLYFMLGNDDPEELGALLDSAPWGTHDEGKVVWLDDEHEMISCGLLERHAVAHVSRAGRGRSCKASIDAMVPLLRAPRARRVQPARAAVRHAARRGAAARREPDGAGVARSGADGGRGEHRGPRRRADLSAAARTARSHPRVRPGSGGSAGPSSSTRAATIRPGRSTAR